MSITFAVNRLTYKHVLSVTFATVCIIETIYFYSKLSMWQKIFYFIKNSFKGQVAFSTPPYYALLTELKENDI